MVWGFRWGEWVQSTSLRFRLRKWPFRWASVGQKELCDKVLVVRLNVCSYFLHQTGWSWTLMAHYLTCFALTKLVTLICVRRRICLWLHPFVFLSYRHGSDHKFANSIWIHIHRDMWSLPIGRTLTNHPALKMTSSPSYQVTSILQ